MTVTIAAQASFQERRGLRPLDPVRDLGRIADLIASAFAHELDERGEAALREMRWMSRLSPLVWWWSQADPSFQDTFSGYVWEEPDPSGGGPKLVGNASLSRAPGNRRRRIVCNIVVSEGYRGRGIGRKLTEAAIEQARQHGADGVLLQVYTDNAPAMRLYSELDFREAGAETDLRLDEVRRTAMVNAPGYRVRQWRHSDGEQAYDLARRITPPVERWLRPLRLDDYRPSWLTRLDRQLRDLLAGRRLYQISMLKDKALVAVLSATASFRSGYHRLDLLVDPEHAGLVTDPLVSRGLHLLSAAPPAPVRATVNRSHESILDTLSDFGFREVRTLLTLRKDF